MLAGHSRIACGPETHFSNKLSAAQLNAALQDPAWPEQAVKLVSSLTLVNQSVADLFGHSEDELRAFLAARAPSERALLESLTALYAAKQGKPRWAEKTPNHLLHLPKLRTNYPGAPIVRIVRDPRDSALSMRILPWASRSALANAYLWSAWFHKSQPFFEHDVNAMTILYEDLVADPEAVLTGLCSFIGERFEPGMLELRKTAKGVSSPNEHWKAGNARALDQTRTQVWQRELSAAWQRALTYACAEGVEAFGYPNPERPLETVKTYPLELYAVGAYEGALLRLSAQGVSLSEGKPGDSADLLVLPNLTHGNVLANLVKFSRLLLTRRVRGRTTYYLRPDKLRGSKNPFGLKRWAQRVVTVLCRVLATPYPLSAPKSTAPNPAPTSPAQPAAPPAPPRYSLRRIRYWARRLKGRPNPRGRARD